VGMVASAPQGVKIWRKKPELTKAPPPIEGIEELRKIYAALEKKKEGEP
jgi:hypothetical protein